jgi:transcriptional regulator with PAS, ATPase and Fis domain
LANVIHRLSKRASEPFVAVNCGAIPENIVESELFGSKKGSYTGSIADKKGLFETAAGGTLFLDEVGELSPATQVKLLRFLQNHEIRRVGETENRYLDVRIIAATNQDLQKAMEANEFREDLYYRLNTFHIHLPPLRERQIVIPRLIKYFSLKYKDEHGKSIQSIDPAAQMALSIYSYPGNIRELENIVEHAIVLSEHGVIRLEDLPESVRHFHTTPQTYLPSSKGTSNELSPSNATPEDTIIPLSEMERQHIIRALNLLNGNKTDVAAKLGISRATLWRKLKEHKIELGEPEI